MPVIGQLEISDLAVLGAYLVILIIVGAWSSCLNRGSVGGYFLAGRNVHFILAGASLFASNIGAVHFIGIAGSGASNGIVVAAWELNALFVLLLLGWLFVPVYISSGVYTMPEYLKARFGGRRIQIYLSGIAILLYIFTKISADLYSGAIFIEQSAGLPLYPSVIILLVISALFTVLGGLTAVIWTDFVQTIIMLVGAALLMIRAYMAVGGYGELYKKYPNSHPSTTDQYYLILNNSQTPLVSNLSLMSQQALNRTLQYGKCGEPNPDAFHLFRGLEDSELPWPAMIFGISVNAIWYWCADQVIVQRVLAAKNLTHAKLGCVLAGYLKLLPLFLIVFPGMVARILFPNEVACADPDICQAVCHKRSGCGDIAYPTIMLRLLPQGLRGVLLAVALSSLVSSLTSIFNSASAIFTMDFWRFIRKQAGEMELMIVGRLFVLVLVGLSVAWIPMISSGSELFSYMQKIVSFLAPPITSVYLLALLWPRINEQGAFWSLIIGLPIGLARFVTEIIFPPVPCGEVDNRPGFVKDVPYPYYGLALMFFCMLVCAIISYLTKPIPDECLHRVVFWTRYNTEDRVDIDSLNGKGKSPSSGTSNAADTTNAKADATQPNQNSPVPQEAINPAFKLEESGLGNSGPEKNLPSESIPLQDMSPVVSNNPLVVTSDNKDTTATKVENVVGAVRVVDAPTVQAKAKLPLWKRILFFTCGIEESMLEKKDPNAPEKPEKDETTAQLLKLIQETPLEKFISWTNFAIVLIVAIGVFAFFR